MYKYTQNDLMTHSAEHLCPQGFEEEGHDDHDHGSHDHDHGSHDHEEHVSLELES